MLKMLIRVAKFLAPRHKTVVVALVFSLLKSVFQTLPLGALYLLLVHRDDMRAQIPMLIVIVVIALIGQMGCKAVTQYLLAPLGFQLFADERIRIGQRLKAAPMGYFNRTRLGEITSAVTNTMADAEMYIAFAFERVVSALFGYLAIMAFMLVLDWLIGIAAALVLGGALWCITWINRTTAAIMPKRQTIQQGVVTQVMELIGGATLLRSFNCESIVSNRLYRSFRDSSRFGFKAEMKVIPVSLAYQLILKWGALLLAALAVGLYLGGIADMSLALVMLVASFALVLPLESLGNDLTLLRVSVASLDLIEPVRNAPILQADLEAPRNDAQRGGCQALGATAPALPVIEFRNVSFSYEDRATLRDVEACFPAGSTTALIGPSGAGKTTLCNLMMRFWDVDSGSVHVLGRDVRAWEPDELLANFAVVFQNVYLFSDTVAANIRFGCPEASVEQVRKAAEQARCLEFIEALPNGFDTILSEGGASLSGGEKQRISIARAILKNAPIVILDEATSAVDPENERELQLALDALCRGKTRIVIAHNMATVRDADQILVFEQGKIVQRGTHTQLSGEHGIYHDFLQVRRSAAGWRIAH